MRKHKKVITLNDWTDDFPMGVPTEEEFEKAWEYQKGIAHDISIDNMLDYKEYWPQSK